MRMWFPCKPAIANCIFNIANFVNNVVVVRHKDD